MILAKYFNKQVKDNFLDLGGKNILELGSGTAIVSIMLANLGILFL